MIRAKFNYHPQQTQNALKKTVLTVQKKVAFQLLDGIINMTPVQTGRARGNWQVALGTPNVSMDWEKKDRSGGGTIAAGSVVISSLQDYGTIYLTNNLPYILPLENGHSRQAPAGMVQVSLDRVAAQFG